MSDTAAILASLKLGRLRHPGSGPGLQGFDILELGCGRGELSAALLSLGAASLAACDRDENAVAEAKALCPKGTFFVGSGWDVPERTFDLIVCAGGLDGEPRERELMAKLAGHLKPGGTLVLECGMVNDHGPSGSWRQVQTPAGPRRYATKTYLLGEVLRDYAARFVGRGRAIAGDPIPRAVFHCALRQPVAILLSGPANTGKSTLSRALMGKTVPVYTTDELLGRLLMGQPHLVPAELLVLRAQGFTPHTLDRASRFIETSGLATAFARIVLAECPFEANVFVIEGEALKHAAIHTAVQHLLEQRGAIVWKLAKLKPVPDGG